MGESRAAYRYALSFIEVAEEFKQLDSVSADIESIAALLKGSAEFRQFIRSPIIRTEKKRTVVEGLFRGKTSDVTYKFLRLLVAKNRESILPEIVSQFKHLRDERLGILEVTVRSAVKLDTVQMKGLTTHLERITKKKVRMNTIIDPSLVGGIALRYADTVWDGSVRRQLENLRRRLIEGNA